MDADSFDHARVMIGHLPQKDLIQANAVVDLTVAETVEEAAADVAETEDVAETVEEAAATEVAVAETVEEAAATEVVVDSDNVAKAAVAVLVGIDCNSK